jgi:hypothetical protein
VVTEEILRFSKRDTTLIKGIAIILMVCNHLYPIAEWIYPENQYISVSLGTKTLAAYWGGFSKICVAMFALLTGMAMFYTYSNKKLINAYQHTLKKLPSFYTTYWIILITVFLPVIAIVWGRDAIISASSLIGNFTGYMTTFCKIAWYVRFYFELVLTFPIIVICYRYLISLFRFDKTNLIALLVFICILGEASNYLPDKIEYFASEYLNYISVVVVGYWIAEKQMFTRLADKIKNLKLVYQNGLCFFIFVLCFLGRGALKNIGFINFDCLYAPAVIFSIWSVIRKYEFSVFNKILGFMGKYSLELWFLHAIFFIGNSTVQRIAYWPKISVLILVWVLLILSPIAIIEQKIVNFLIRRFA